MDTLKQDPSGMDPTSNGHATTPVPKDKLDAFREEIMKKLSEQGLGVMLIVFGNYKGVPRKCYDTNMQDRTERVLLLQNILNAEQSDGVSVVPKGSIIIPPGVVL